MFVYHWPNYALLRREFPERSPTVAFCQACLYPSLPHRTVATLPDGHNLGSPPALVAEEDESEDGISSTQQSCFFPQQLPHDYFTESAQRVLSESARSTLRTIAEDDSSSTGDTVQESKMETSFMESPAGDLDGVETGVMVVLHEATTIEVRGIDGTSDEEKQCDES